jgi:hypothetical protein
VPGTVEVEGGLTPEETGGFTVVELPGTVVVEVDPGADSTGDSPRATSREEPVRDLELAAELLAELAYNDEVRQRIIAGQRRRLEDFGPARLRQHLDHLLARVH